jgi:hypothetical protein
MQAVLLPALACGGLLLAWWAAAGGPPPGEILLDARPEPAPRVRPTCTGAAARAAVDAPPGETTIEAGAAQFVGPLAPVAEPGPERIPWSAAEGLARRYFHAYAAVEELGRLLPAEEAARTRERFPGWFAAIAEGGRLGQDLARIEPPGARAPLPELDLAAREPADFERIYGRLPREDFLLERWRLAHFAHAESQRLLARQLDGGPYTVRPQPSAGVWG